MSADYGGSGLSQVWHGDPQPTVLGQVAGPKAQHVEEQIVEATGLAYGFVDVAAEAVLRRQLRKEVTSVAAGTPEASEASHVGASPKTSSQGGNRLSVADAGKDKCVGNVCAIMKNQEMKASPASGYTVKELEQEFDVTFGRLSSGKPNKLVATPERAIPTIEKLTGLKAINPKSPVNFALAKAEGSYAIFLNDSHVIYARIGSGGKMSILDATVERG
jgi:hypothetical protein